MGQHGGIGGQQGERDQGRTISPVLAREEKYLQEKQRGQRHHGESSGNDLSARMGVVAAHELGCGETAIMQLQALRCCQFIGCT